MRIRLTDLCDTSIAKLVNALIWAVEEWKSNLQGVVLIDMNLVGADLEKE
jgi:hypothetical protein